MKKVAFSIALMAVLTLMTGSALAQYPFNIHAPSAIGGQVAQAPVSPAAAPKYCKPCLFYGGDWASTDSNWVAFANGDGGGFGGLVNMYSGFTVPKGKTWTVTGLFSNNLFINIDHFTPATPEWSINKGMAAGSAGKVIASGKTKGTGKATGRSCCSGYNEYTVDVPKLSKKVVLKAGKYVEAVTPPCDTTKDSACSSGLYYETDTYDPANTGNQGANHFGPKAPLGYNFQNGAPFGLNYVQINAAYCTSQGYQSYACNFFSAGVIGTQK